MLILIVCATQSNVEQLHPIHRKSLFSPYEYKILNDKQYPSGVQLCNFEVEMKMRPSLIRVQCAVCKFRGISLEEKQ